MMPDGVEQAVADADLALDQLSPTSGWRPAALALRGTAHALLGATDRATDDLTAGIDAGLAGGAAEVVIVAQAQLALLAARQGSWGEAGERARAGQELVEDAGLGDYSSSALAHAATARVALHEFRQEDARVALTRAHRLRPLLDRGLPWLTVQVGVELARAHLGLGEAGAARTVLTESERVLELRPHLGCLAEDARDLRDRVDATSGSDGAWAMSLTGAELRLLPYLATHLMFPEIASQAVRVAQHHQVRGCLDLPQTWCLIAQRCGRARRRGRPVGELGLPSGGEFHPGGMTRRRSAPVQIGRPPMDEYKDHLRRLAVHDDVLLDAVSVDGSASAVSVIDEKTAALLRVAATIAVDAAPYSFQHAIALALAAGATSDEIVASLEAVTPVTGAARVVQCAPKVALALGYDVDAALERRDE